MTAAATRFATPIDAFAHGEYRSGSSARRITGRITDDGSSGYVAEPGRYHLYAGWFCPWSQRAAIQRALNGLDDVVSVSYVDGLRDGRGWAFREATGPDPVNGFALLREVYETSQPGYTGNVTVPVLWDRATRTIVSNDATTIDLDLATQFRAWATPGVDTYPDALRSQIDELDRAFGPILGQRLGRAVYDRPAAQQVLAAFRELDSRLATRRYLCGPAITEADVRIWVTLVRYDAGVNAHGAVGPKLSTFKHLWAYARDLYSQPAFAQTTRFDAFAAPFANLPDWTE